MAGFREERILIWCVLTTPMTVKGSGLSDPSGLTKMSYMLMMVLVPGMCVLFRTYRADHQKGRILMCVNYIGNFFLKKKKKKGVKVK